MVAQMLEKIQQFQNHRYLFDCDAKIEDLFVKQELRWWNEETLYRMSLKDAPSLWNMGGERPSFDRKSSFKHLSFTSENSSEKVIGNASEPSNLIASKLIGVSVPDYLSQLFTKAQDTIDYFFSTAVLLPDKGIIKIGNARYLLIRGASLSSELFEVLNQTALNFDPQMAADYVYDWSYSVGISDAAFFKQNEFLATLKSIREIIAGVLVQMSYEGWCFANVHRVSVSEDSKKFCLEFHSVRCVEANMWEHKEIKNLDHNVILPCNSRI